MSARTRKPRPEAKLLNLPEDQAAALSEWLLSGMSYGKARALVKKEFGISVGLSSLSRFWEAVCAPELLQRRARTVKMADAFAEAVEQQPGQWDKVLMQQIKQKTFELANSPQVSAEDLMFLMGLVQKGRDQDLKERDLQLKRDKFEFDAAAAALKHLPALRQIAADKSLNEQARLNAVRQRLFGEAIP